MHDTGCAIGCSWMRMQQDSCWRSQYRSGEALLVCRSCRSVALGGVVVFKAVPAGLLRQLKKPGDPCFKRTLLSNMHKDVLGRRYRSLLFRASHRER